jgi:1,2-diacylglycerol 3-beta-galactosyltransferase
MDESAVPLLFLVADTGGGHRAAAHAVGQALPAAFRPVLCDPLGGARAPALLRRLTGLYGPLVRHSPLLWGLVFYGSDSCFATRLLRRTVFALSERPVEEAVAQHRPALIVSFHPLLVWAAVQAGSVATPVVTVVTDLITVHAAWRHDRADLVVTPSAAARARCLRDGLAPGRCVEIGLPVATGFTEGPLRPPERAARRRSLGIDEHRFLVVLTGGGEGAGGLARRTTALLRRFDDVQVVTVCGRNRRLVRSLNRLATRSNGRLTVMGFVPNMADWLHSADLVVTKAGPGTIAEATSCGTPLALTCHTPGQERRNTEYVVDAGAGRHARGVRSLLSLVDRLRGDPAELDAMRAASARLGRPGAAAETAARLVRLATAGSEPRAVQEATR